TWSATPTGSWEWSSRRWGWRPIAPPHSCASPLPPTTLLPGPASRMDPFVHLHVASGYSLQYGASHPHVLVERAAEQEMDTLALTDRDGTYGAVKHARACRAAGLRPVLGVDLAVTPLAGERSQPVARRSRTPLRGGAFRDD